MRASPEAARGLPRTARQAGGAWNSARAAAPDGKNQEKLVAALPSWAYTPSTTVEGYYRAPRTTTLQAEIDTVLVIQVFGGLIVGLVACQLGLFLVSSFRRL